MRNFQTAFTSLRSALVCASAALLLVACGDSNNEQNPNPGSTNTPSATGGNTGSGGGATTTEEKKKSLGQNCENAAECESNNCREITIKDPTKEGDEKFTTKSCSACNTDADCKDPAKGNLCVPGMSSFVLDSLHYTCGKGQLGGGCVDNSHCSENRVCGEILGGFTTCGECASDADCKDSAKPSCVLKQEGTTGYRVCGAKLPDGERCSGTAGSDSECENFCAVIKNNLVPVPVGVCSPCKEDSNCAAGQTCTPPSLDITSAKLTAAKCEAKPDTGATTGTSTETNTGTGTGTATETGGTVTATSTDSTT